MANKRKVKVFKRSWPHGYQLPPAIEEVGVGDFHCWGCDYEEFEAGPGNYTFAIVEMPDGSIITPRPESVVFIKEG